MVNVKIGKITLAAAWGRVLAKSKALGMPGRGNDTSKLEKNKYGSKSC